MHRNHLFQCGSNGSHTQASALSPLFPSFRRKENNSKNQSKKSIEDIEPPNQNLNQGLGLMEKNG
jgi:hypothetical protein